MNCQLQANTAGAWKTVMTFGQVGEDMERVKFAIRELHDVSPDTSWRVTTTANPPKVLAHLGRNTYGLWVMRSPEA